MHHQQSKGNVSGTGDAEALGGVWPNSMCFGRTTLVSLAWSTALDRVTPTLGSILERWMA
jgi:hypothetical protein